jgi:hypothetical protein
VAITVTQTTDISQVLADQLDDQIAGMRVEWYVADKTRPPVCVIGLPDIDWSDQMGGFCWTRWEFPLTVIVSRSNDREAQRELSRIVRDIAVALTQDSWTAAGIHDVTMLDARPTTATIGGQELPAYLVRVQVTA